MRVQVPIAWSPRDDDPYLTPGRVYVAIQSFRRDPEDGKVKPVGAARIEADNGKTIHINLPPHEDLHLTDGGAGADKWIVLPETGRTQA